MNTQKQYATYLDSQDELCDFREEFYIPKQQIYFDGNSLGLLSERAEKAVQMMMDSWKKHAIDGWQAGDEPWFYLPEKLGTSMATLVGADSSEVIATGSTTTNIHQLVASFYRPNGKRTKILADDLNFPSDIYALKSQLERHGYDPATHLKKVKSADGQTLKTQAIIDAMTNDVALILLPSVLYRSGQILDMESLTKAAHERGITIGFDLCHSIGAIPHQLSEWGVDFAMWCTYKHLNGGPGSAAGLYVNKHHFGQKPGLAGWFSSNKEQQFDMSHTLTPAADVGAYQMGTPHLLSLAPLIGALDLFQEAGIDRIRTKSIKLTTYFIDLIDAELADFGFSMVTPRQPDERGGHILLTHPEAARICKALKADGVIPDFRTPNGIRLAPVALYNTFFDVWQTVAILKRIMEEERYKNYENKRGVIA